MPILTEQERCGTQLAGKYQLESILGRGGMGVVFRARHLHTQRPVAIKILRPEFSQDRTLGKRFVREARAASSIRHPNVVAVLDLGIDDDGTIYQVLELLDGEGLSAHLERKGELTVERTLELLLPVMSGLVVAHAQGIVHRDLKPDNIFLARNHDGRVTPTLLDFGIAKLVDAGSSLATHTGSVLGTPQYMAPEQARGAKEQGAGIDVWAMGIIAFECLSGRVPFDGSTPALVMVQIMTERAPRLDVVNAAVPAELALVIERALMPAPADRFGAMSEFVEALREAASAVGIPLPAPRESTAGPITLRPMRDTLAAHAATELPAGVDTRGATHELAAARADLMGRDSRVETVASASTPARSPRTHEAIATPVERAPEPARAPTRRGALVAVALAALLGIAALGALALRGGAGEPQSPSTGAQAPSAPALVAHPGAAQPSANPAPLATPPIAEPTVVEPAHAALPPADARPGARGPRAARLAAVEGAAPGAPVPPRAAPNEAAHPGPGDAPAEAPHPRAHPGSALPEVVEW